MRISDWSSDVCSSDLSARRSPSAPLGGSSSPGRAGPGCRRPRRRRRAARPPRRMHQVVAGPAPGLCTLCPIETALGLLAVAVLILANAAFVANELALVDRTGGV